LIVSYDPDTGNIKERWLPCLKISVEHATREVDLDDEALERCKKANE
jgi:hypothetical protein